MNRRKFLLSLGVAVAIAPMAWAQSYADQVVQQLVAMGYVNIQVEATLLGRIRISADGSGGKREIILNPKTGEILRDILFDASGNPVPRLAGSSDDGDNSGSGSDDNGGDDNSGSGSDDDNSGSGGGDDDNSGSDDKGDDKGDDRDDDRDKNDD